MSPQTVLSFLDRRSRLLALLLVSFATIRIASTYHVFSHTADEPIHIACGLEWLSRGAYKYEPQHPPLTRVLSALGPWLDGARTIGNQDNMVEGLYILRGAGNDYARRLTLARAGILPFFWIACLAVFLTGRKMLGGPGAVLSLFVFTMFPAVLAHSALATTDAGAMAFFALAVYAFFSVLQQPSVSRGLAFGAALAGMILCKFSNLAFFPAAIALSAIVFRRRIGPLPGEAARLARSLLVSLLCAAAACFLLLWAGYRFSTGSTPFPELFQGVRDVARHNQQGHLTYLLGDRSDSGFWVYFPIVLLIKTPLAVLLMCAAALWLPARPPKQWPAWLAWTVFCGVFAVAMSARINIGFRHILPGIPFLVIAAAGGLLALAERASRSNIARYGALALVLLLCLPSIAAHPDYLSYFNVLAGDRPEDIIVDSDLDWGQDLLRLGRRLRQLNAPSVAFTPWFAADLDAAGFPPRIPIHPLQPQPGYNAVSLTQLKLQRLYIPDSQPRLQPWPETPGLSYEMIGHSIRLYYFPGAQPPQ